MHKAYTLERNVQWKRPVRRPKSRWIYVKHVREKCDDVYKIEQTQNKIKWQAFIIIMINLLVP